MLKNPTYAGYIEYKSWGVSLRKAQHEGIISYETFLKIQERLEGRAYAPTRNLMAAASDMFKTLWDHREATLHMRRKTLKQECNDA